MRHESKAPFTLDWRGPSLVLSPSIHSRFTYFKSGQWHSLKLSAALSVKGSSKAASSSVTSGGKRKVTLLGNISKDCPGSIHWALPWQKTSLSAQILLPVRLLRSRISTPMPPSVMWPAPMLLTCSWALGWVPHMLFHACHVIVRVLWVILVSFWEALLISARWLGPSPPSTTIPKAVTSGWIQAHWPSPSRSLPSLPL